MPINTPEDGMTGLANGFIASLSKADRDLLEPRLFRLRFQTGDVLANPSDESRLIFFPVTLVVCVRFADRGGGIGMVGREGIVGLSAVLGEGLDDAMEATVLMEGGWTLAITVEDMEQVCLASPTLSLALLGFLHAYSSQLGWMIRARDRGNFRQRLCAWLLMLHDRVDSDFLPLTHGSLAFQLGVRRASVTDALHVLEGEAYLRCSRGLISLMDRAGLRRSAGGSYEPPRGGNAVRV